MARPDYPECEDGFQHGKLGADLLKAGGSRGVPVPEESGKERRKVAQIDAQHRRR